MTAQLDDARLTHLLAQGTGELLKGVRNVGALRGRNLGDAGETLVEGRVGDVLTELRAHRERLRAEHGWVMDVYLLRRGDSAAAGRGEGTTT